MNDPQNRDPFYRAEQLNIEVVWGRLRTCHGLWVPERRTIVLKRGLSRLEERSTLAHELGHAALGHWETTERNEHLADRWAARFLIAPNHLAQVARIYEDAGEWCRELEVEPHILEAYLRQAG